MSSKLQFAVVAGFLWLAPNVGHAQLQMGSPAMPASGSATPAQSALDPAYSEDIQPLLEADRRFAAEVLKGGGAVFASWFAEDAVTLNNGKGIVQGRSQIARDTNWKPDEYQLVWSPDGGRMGPSHDSGVTWGSYQGHSKDHQGNPLTISGRYITVWRREKSGAWKVVLDASNDAPPEAGSCCSVR